MKNSYLLIGIWIFSHITASATGLTRVELFAPENHAIQTDTINLLFEWYQAIDNSGEKVTYDLYLGTNPNPALFKSDLDPGINGHFDINGREWIFESNLQKDGVNYPAVAYINAGADTLGYFSTYYWKVIAKNESGETTESEIFSFTTYRENSLPTVPVLLSPSNGEVDVSATPTLTWTQSTDADGDLVNHYLQIRKGNEQYRNVAFTGADTTYTFTTQLKDFTTYYWRVFAIDEYTYDVVYSSPSSFTVENYYNDPPVMGSLLSPSNGAKNMGFDILCKWNAATDADNDAISYTIFADTKNNPETVIAYNITDTSIIHRFNEYGTFYWKVIAKDTFGNSETSSIYSFSCWENAPSIFVEMVEVDAGSFMMGQSDFTQEYVGSLHGNPIYWDVTDENPAHPVSLREYKIGKYEITNRQYADFLNAIVDNITIGYTDLNAHRRKSFLYRRASFKGFPLCKVFDNTRDLSEREGIEYEPVFDSPIIWNGSYFEVDPNFMDHPVRFIYYYGAYYFAKWNGDFRLPTEAEWEFAALGGNSSNGYIYSGSNNPDDIAVHSIDKDISTEETWSTEPVGSRNPNELGLYDMSGNAEEICEDMYNKDFYIHSPVFNPVYTIQSGYLGRVLRGGYYASGVHTFLRVKRRGYTAWEQFINSTGIRLVQSSEYEVSGQVRDAGGNPLPHISIIGFPNQVTTDANGRYSTTVVGGWSGSIQAYSNTSEFSPNTISFSELYADTTDNIFNLVAETNTYTIRFQINNGSTAIENAEINFNGTLYTTDANGQVTISNLASGIYSYTISAAGYEVFSSSVSVTNNDTYDIQLMLTTRNKIISEESVKIYPNPSNGTFHVEIQGNATLCIYSAIGELLMKKDMTNSIQVTLNCKGLFFILLKNENGYISRKILLE